MSILRKAVVDTTKGSGTFKLKVPEPKPLRDARSYKELKNFLWDMKHFFNVAKIKLDG